MLAGQRDTIVTWNDSDLNVLRSAASPAPVVAIVCYVMMLVMVPGYLLPTIIATTRNIPNAGAVAVINIFLGWTCLGWIVALAMSVGGTRPATPVAWPATKKCPDCADGARRCQPVQNG
jgi:Superinfection immunity protein